ncbi:hypothetical protein Nepgr_015592 [Nepenthes gracilis]|uniref:Stress-response A/B barrel domain-containing protein n=1 Tax=Nepenthes gracilis TaxID=150966 RepID=A0AAD3SNW0_NEPGR|nr:hypothetical protein Nepgr_015592 [Nepenthes gracilis]
MSSQLIEHVVLFNVKDNTDPSKANAMVDGLNGLSSLDVVLYLTAGPIHRLRSTSLKFTHMLHSRYRTVDDLSIYTNHPDHLSVVRENAPIMEDIMALDWIIQDLDGAAAPLPGSAMRVQFVKLKEELEDKEKGKVLEVIGELKEKVEEIRRISVGENFSPARAKGFSIGSIEFFPGLNELDSAAEKGELGKEKEKVRDYSDGVVVVDYVVPAAQSAIV